MYCFLNGVKLGFNPQAIEAALGCVQRPTLRWQWIVLSRLGVALLSFVLISWYVACFWAPPLRPPRLLTRQLCGSGCVCRPEFSIIRLKNNRICLKPDESLFTLGEEFRFHDSSRFRKKAGDAKLRFYHSFVPVLMSLAAESCRSRAELVHLLKPYLQWERVERVPTLWLQTTKKPQCARWCQNCSICLMPIFGVGKVYRIWTPKGVISTRTANSASSGCFMCGTLQKLFSIPTCAINLKLHKRKLWWYWKKN